MADLEFDVAVRRHEPITFTLGLAPGDTEKHVYTFVPPKSAVMLMPILETSSSGGERNMDLTKATFDWLGDGMSEEDNERIKSRLKDKNDDLDVDTLSKVVEGLSEKVSARPTT